MEYTRLGRTGLRVSRIGLGCMSYGDPGTFLHRWTLDEDAAAAFFRQAVELGVTFWDTANVYQGGSSEEFVGRAVTTFSRREDIVLATEVSGKMHDGPGGSGLSRKAILEQADASLRRLGTDYIDVYYIHRFDPEIPVEETMAALDDLVLEGVRPEMDRPVIDAVQQIAEARGVSMAQVALAWVLSKPVVSCPIVGATEPHHLPDAVAALDLELTDAEVADLERLYTPQDNYWW